MMESHLPEVIKKIKGPVLIGNKVQAAVNALGKLECDCYVCKRIDKNLSAMIATTSFLWESDYCFKEKFKKIGYFCLPHYKQLVDYSSKKMSKRNFNGFYDTAYGIVMKYAESLQKDVSWFCKKFDYRYDEEPWYNSKDSVARSEKFLSGEFGWDD